VFGLSAECMALGIEEAKAALTKAKDEYAMHYNYQRKPAPVFALGDRVWLDGSDIATNRPLSKLSHQCLGSAPPLLLPLPCLSCSQVVPHTS
jgi:hypothetical protein